MHADLRGCELRIMPQPPEFVSRPWFPLTVRIDSIGTSVGVDQLAANLRTQLGWDPGVPVTLRLQHIKVYGPLVSFTSGPLAPLNVGYRDFIAEQSTIGGTVDVSPRVLEQFTRYPDQTNRACVGYKYGITHSSLALSGGAAAGSDTVLLNVTGAGPGSLVLVHLLFRSGQINPAQPSNDDSSSFAII
jgi:hypothetical protein